MDRLNGDHPDILIDDACILAHDSRVRAEQQQKLESQRAIERRQHEEEEEEEEERALIREITGQQYLFEDLEAQLVSDYRAGRDVNKWLDAMKAVDDLRLQRCGLHSWGEVE